MGWGAGWGCSHMGRLFAMVGEPKGCRGRAESPLHASVCANFVVRSSLPRGMTRRLRRGWWGCRPMGFSPASVPEGFQRASGKPFGAPAGAYSLPGWGLTRRLRRGWWGCRPMVFSPASVSEGFQRASGKPFGASAGAYSLPRVGNDAPTTAREQGLQPYGAFTLFFRWRKKSVQKKASGTATPGKRLLLPILTAGLVMSRAA